jgi:hypothetical protein
MGEQTEEAGFLFVSECDSTHAIDGVTIFRWGIGD